MSGEHERTEKTDPPDDDPLVAYLDGEMAIGARREIEQSLSTDPELLRRLQQHERVWDLLDELPRSDMDESFTQSTVKMVALAAANDLEETERKTSLRQRMAWIAGGAGITAAAVVGYLWMASAVSAPNRQLVEDLPVIEHLDAYRHAESIEFLQALEREGLFAVEVEDAL